MDRRLGSNERVNICNTEIDVLTASETVDLVEEYIKKKEPLHLMGVNADKINAVNLNLRMKQIVNGCGIINADGASAVLASRFLNKKLPERVAGVDLMESLVELCEKKSYTIFLLGAKQEVVELASDKIRKMYPNIKIVGIRNGYFSKSEWDSISDEIKNINPDICFVGITSPLKEYLIEFFQEQGHKSVFMGVGGTFDVISGKVHRAPKWIQKINMEWVYRMMQEPQRLFARYYVGNLMFIKRVLKDKREV